MTSYAPDDISATVRAGVGAAAGVTQTVDAKLTSSWTQLVAQVEHATATGGDLQVELGALATFYNELSQLQDELQRNLVDLRSRVHAVSSADPGVALPGLATLWGVVRQSLGHASVEPDNLLDNLAALNFIVIGHMRSAFDTINAYAAAEQLAVERLDQVGAGLRSSS